MCARRRTRETTTTVDLRTARARIARAAQSASKERGAREFSSGGARSFGLVRWMARQRSEV